MQLIRDVLNLNPILTVALLAWFVAQVQYNRATYRAGRYHQVSIPGNHK